MISKTTLRCDIESYLTTEIPGHERAQILDSLISLSRAGSTDPLDRERKFAGWIAERSSGTTGPAMWLPKTKSERLALSLSVWRHRQRYCGQRRQREFEDVNRYIAASPKALLGLDGNSLHSYYSALGDGGVKHIYGHLSLLRSHGRSLTGSKIRPFEVVEVTGQDLDAESEASLVSGLGVRVLNQYGCSETSAIGYCWGTDNMFAIIDSVRIEVIGDDGRTILGDGEVGAVVVTSLMLRLLPIIRFSTGDRGTWITLQGQRLLQLEPERSSSKILLRSNVSISGIGLMKRIIGGARSENGDMVLYHWKVRRRGPIFTVSLDPRDCSCAASIKKRFAREQSILGEHQVIVETWNGWAPLEKQILFASDSS